MCRTTLGFGSAETDVMVIRVQRIGFIFALVAHINSPKVLIEIYIATLQHFQIRNCENMNTRVKIKNKWLYCWFVFSILNWGYSLYNIFKFESAKIAVYVLLPYHV